MACEMSSRCSMKYSSMCQDCKSPKEQEEAIKNEKKSTFILKWTLYAVGVASILYFFIKDLQERGIFSV